MLTDQFKPKTIWIWVLTVLPNFNLTLDQVLILNLIYLKILFFLYIPHVDNKKCYEMMQRWSSTFQSFFTKMPKKRGNWWLKVDRNSWAACGKWYKNFTLHYKGQFFIPYYTDQNYNLDMPTFNKCSKLNNTYFSLQVHHYIVEQAVMKIFFFRDLVPEENDKVCHGFYNEFRDK